MDTKYIRAGKLLALIGLGVITGLTPLSGRAFAQGAPASSQVEIAPDVQSLIAQMGKTLSSKAFSFQSSTIREYTDSNGYPLHIFHHAAVLVRRPDRLSVDIAGDDGRVEMAYDGNSLTVFSQNTNKYVSQPASGTIQQVLHEATLKSGVDFPLGDFVADAPDKAFLSEVKTGVALGEVTIDDVICVHMFFVQPPAIEIEAWVEKNEHAFPRRLIVTYRDIAGQPRFISQMSAWNLSPIVSDTDFAIQIPPTATKVEEVRR